MSPKKTNILLSFVVGTTVANFAYAEVPAAIQEQSWDDYEQKVIGAFASFEKAQLDTWEQTRKSILQKWPDGLMPEKKVYVKYFRDNETRIIVNYEKGDVQVQTLVVDQSNQKERAKKEIEEALNSAITQDPQSTTAALSLNEVPGHGSISKSKLIGELATHVRPSVKTTGSDKIARQTFELNFKLVPDHVRRRALKYKSQIDYWSAKHSIDPALVLAVIRQESAFNPYAKSWVGALGLMQIYPPYAGKEVLKVTTGKDMIPTPDFLYQPENNIMMGTTFIQILRDRYFSQIEDNEKRKYLIICAYNWSAGRLKKAIAKGRLRMTESSEKVFERLQQITPDETKDYLKRVNQYHFEFKQMIRDGRWSK
jgi:membrane-bound lytic murein transglycosylase C